MQKNIEETALDFCRQSAWEKINEKEYEHIKKEFASLVELYFAEHDDETNRRIYTAMLPLWDGGEMLSIKRNNI